MQTRYGYRWIGACLIAAVILAFGMTATDTTFVSAVGGDIRAYRVDTSVLEEGITTPLSPIWNQAPEAESSMASQQIVQPGGSGTVRQVKIRALHDMGRIAVRLEWTDESANTGDQAGLFTDAVAVQWPVKAESHPYQCMGQQDAYVNIWQWKYAWETAGQANIRNYRSSGPGKHVQAQGVTPVAKAQYQDGKWFVVFSRAFIPTAELGTAQIVVGGSTSMAVAIWNGGAGDNRMQKQVTSWNAVAVSPARPGREAEADLLHQALPFLQTLGFLVATVALTLLFLRLIRPVEDPKPAPRSGARGGH